MRITIKPVLVRIAFACVFRTSCNGHYGHFECNVKQFRIYSMPMLSRNKNSGYEARILYFMMLVILL